MFRENLPSLFGREQGGIMSARVRKEYSRTFYYRPIQSGYLCIAYEGLDALVAQKDISVRTVTDLCSDLTSFLLDLIRSDEKPEAHWLLTMTRDDGFRTFSTMRQNMEKTIPYQTYTAMLSKLVADLDIPAGVGIRPMDHLRVEWSTVYYQLVQLVVLLLLLRNRTTMRRVDISVELPERKPEVALQVKIEESDIGSIYNEFIWLQDEIDINLMPERFRFKIDENGIRAAICDATPEPHFRFGSAEIALLTPSISRFIAVFLLYAKAIMSFMPTEDETV